MASLLPFYHRLPPAVRHAVASLKGYQLRRWRYGPETARLVAEALEREYWSAAQWETWRAEQLARVLHRAATRVPYYRNLWAERRRRGDKRSWEELGNWPVLTKEEVRRDPAAFLADDCQPSRMMLLQTSGTSGTPLRLWVPRANVRDWYALSEARWRTWYGVTRHDRWAILGGQLVTPVAQRRPPFWVHNRSLNQLYLSTYHLAPDLIRYYFEALHSFKPKYLLGYSSALHTLAHECIRQRLGGLNLRVVLTNAEPLFGYQRETIEQAFQCPVRETYGMTEMVVAGSECEHGVLHQWPEAGVIEVEDPNAAGTGSFLVSGLVNRGMPLIRYRAGDHGSLKPLGEPCPCGRTLPAFGRIEGRCDDVVLTPDGRRVGRLDPVFKSGLPIRQAQIIQEDLDHVRILVVPTSGFTHSDSEDLKARLAARLGDGIRIEVQLVNDIPLGANGKFRAVVSLAGDRFTTRQ
jgi:phenylacetate-CoA ligase